ncbi:MAG TPA: hypothetical protein VM076_26060 [Gemmatimonadaceae bacterium]|nr:hypothetical protein [Gemmatimonadaceae bacterium]
MSCHFPPDSSIGALRWQKMARFAAERGWAMDVIMMAPEELAGADRSRLSELPPGTRLHGLATPGRPLFAFQLATWRVARRLVGVFRPQSAGPAPSAMSTANGHSTSTLGSLRRTFLAAAAFRSADVWTRRAVALGSALAARTRYACVVSSGPPHMAHDAGRELGGRLGIPFIMDMRDPWCDADAMPPDFRSERWLRLAREHESRCVARAALVVANTSAAEALLRSRYPALGASAMTVMNGADADPLPPSPNDNRFVIAFAGTLYAGRDPGTLFRAVARVVKERALTPAQLSVEFMGSEGFGNVPLAEAARAAGVGEFFTGHSTRPRVEALAFLARATMLVNLPQDVRLSVPAKLFEYVRFPAWLLVLSEPGTATEMLFADTDADVVAPDDVDGIARVISRHYDAFRASGRPAPLNANGQFDRRVQANRLLDALDRLVADSARA